MTPPHDPPTSTPVPTAGAPEATPLPTFHWFLGQMMDPDDEARAIRHWASACGQHENSMIYTLMNNQFNVIYNRAQVMMTFSGLVITVTGFSGRIIAQTSRQAQLFLVGGMSLVLVAAAVAILFVLRIRWLSRNFGRPGDDWIVANLRERNRKTVMLKIASFILVIGFLSYVYAIALMLLDPYKVIGATVPLT